MQFGGRVGGYARGTPWDRCIVCFGDPEAITADCSFPTCPSLATASVDQVVEAAERAGWRGVFVVVVVVVAAEATGVSDLAVTG